MRMHDWGQSCQWGEEVVPIMALWKFVALNTIILIVWLVDIEKFRLFYHTNLLHTIKSGQVPVPGNPSPVSQPVVG
jgi:hypothetical protein